MSPRAPTACRHTVSGSLSLPSRGAFHLSLTVLVHYRSLWVFSLGRWSSLIPAGFHVPRGTWDPPCTASLFAYRAFTFCGGAFQPPSAKFRSTFTGVPQPRKVFPLRGLGCPLFARRYYGDRFCFLFLRVLRCFSSPGAPPVPMDSVQDDGGSPPPGCPIRISTDLRLLAAPRGFSQLATSFFGPKRQGIHRMPFLA